MLVVGLDLSLTSTGFCIDQHDADPRQATQRLGIYTTDATGRGEGTLAARMAEIVCAIMDRIGERGVPDLIAIENFAFKGHSTLLLARLYGILSVELLGLFGGNESLMNERIVMVPPATLKRAFCGKGNAEKVEMRDAAERRFGRVIKSFDAVDAFALWRLGCCCLNQNYCLQRHEFEGVATVMGLTTEDTEEARFNQNLAKLFRE